MKRNEIGIIIDINLGNAYKEIMKDKSYGDITPTQEERLDQAKQAIMDIMLEVYNQNN